MSIKRNLIIIGDINVNIMDTSNYVKEYVNVIKSNNFQILNKIQNNSATRITNKGTATIIDHFVTNIDLSKVSAEINLSETTLSDHKHAQINIKYINK